MQNFNPRNFSLLCIALFCSVLIHGDAYSVEESFAEQSYQSLLHKLRLARQQLKSGKFHVAATTVESLRVQGAEEGTEVDRESWHADVAFDAQRDQSMMQYRLTGDLYGAIEPPPENLLFVTMLDGARFKVINPLLSRPRKSNGLVQSYANYDCAPTAPRPFIAPLNPRCVGIVDLHDMQRGDSLDTVLLNMRVQDRADMADSVIRLEIDENQIALTQLYKNKRVRMRTLFDCRRDLVPVAKTVENGVFDDETGTFSVSLVYHESLFEWQRVNREYVPISITATTYRPERSKRADATPDVFDVREAKSNVNLHWQEVNEPISSALFKMDAFNAKDTEQSDRD